MKSSLLALFGISLITAAAAGACVVEETVEDDGGTGNEGGGVVDPGPENILTDSEMLSQAEIERRTYYLASPELQGRAPGSEGGLMARQFIIDELNACGVQPLDPAGFEQPIAALPGAANLLAVIPGTDDQLKDRYVMLTSHYDHLGSAYVGADDDAVAVATSLGVACALAQNPQPRSVIIAAFDAEEPPNFLTQAMGSIHYVNNPVVPLEQTDVMIAMELIGSDLWPGYPNHAVLGAELSPQVNEAVDATTVPEGLLVHSMGLHLVEEDRVDSGGANQPWGDYDGFRQNRVPVMLLVNGYNHRYHTPQDTPDTLNYPKVQLQSKYILQMVSRLAHLAETPVWQPNNVETRDRTRAGDPWGGTYEIGGDHARDAAALQQILSDAVAQGGIVEQLGLTEASRAGLQGDLDQVTQISAKMDGGGALSADEVRRLRYSVQRVMCLTSGAYDESLCMAAVP